MPCEDQTEYLEVLFDYDDRVDGFQLQKRTCGKEVGGDLLLPFVKGMFVDDILQKDVRDFIPDYEQLSVTEEFLFFKQFFSLRAACAVFIGERAGSAKEPFVMEELSYDEEHALLKGSIAVDLIHSEIQACGGCRGCAPRKAKKAELKEERKQAYLNQILTELSS